MFSAGVFSPENISLFVSGIRLELENRLAALEQQRALQDAADHAQKEEWEERFRSTQQGEESARRELHNLRYRTLSDIKRTQHHQSEGKICYF